MTFLELCRATSLKSGLVSSQNLMTATAGQAGRHLKIVTAVIDAWNTIQTGRSDWAWMRAAFNGNLVIGQGSYTPAQVGIAARFRAFVPDRNTASECFRPLTIYDQAIGRSDETSLHQVSPEAWRTTYDRGVQTNSRPVHYAVENGQLLVGPLPDKAYAIRGLYMKAAQILAADGDVPELPVDFHDVIKWRAILDLDGQDGAFADRTIAQAEYSRLYRLLANERTAPVALGGSLA